MAVYSCVVGLYQRQGQLNTAVVELGKQFVIAAGVTRMLLLFVDSWDSQLLVYMISYSL